MSRLAERLITVLLLLLFFLAGKTPGGTLFNERSRVSAPSTVAIPIVEEALPEDRRLPFAQIAAWMESYPETGMTFVEYVCSQPIRPDAKRNVIYLIPVGGFHSSSALKSVSCFLSAYYNLPVKVAPEKKLKMPTAATRNRRLDADQVIFSLSAELPADALLGVGITGDDLFSGRLHGVFGLGYADMRTCLVSTRRIWGESSDSVLSEEHYRLCKLIIHEIGHTLGLPHCSAYCCIMNSTVGVASIDRAPLDFCGPCQKKLTWLLQWNPLVRAERIDEAAIKVGWRQARQEFTPVLARLRSKDRRDDPRILMASLAGED